MRIKNYAYRLMGAVCAFAVVACVENNFDIDDVSTEVTIGNGTTTLPLGYFENKTLGDLLGGEDIDGLMKDENGNLSFNFSGEGDTIDIDNITTEFEIPQVSKSFNVDYPDLDFDMGNMTISAETDIDIVGLEGYSQLPGGRYYLPAIEGLKFSGSLSESFSSESIEMDIPEQIKGVNKVIFRDIESGHHGAPMHLRVNFEDLADINGGGTLNFSFNISGAKFRFLDANNEFLYEGDSFVSEYQIKPGTGTIDFVVYIESLINETGVDENNHLSIPIVLSYDMDFEIAAKSGEFSLSNKPHLSLEAEFEYADAQVMVSSDVNLIECAVSEGDPIEVAGLPEEIKSICRIAMKQHDNATLCFYAKGLEEFGDIANDVEVAVTLPEYLQLHCIDEDGYSFDAATHELKATAMALANGIEIGVDALDFGAEGLCPVDGAIELYFYPQIVARFKESKAVNISSMMLAKDKLEVNVGIDEAKLCIESISGRVDYAYTVDQEFALTGLDQLNLKIEGLGLKPIIEVNVTHPLTMSAFLAGTVVPTVGGVPTEENRVEFNVADIPAAKYADGEIIPANVTLIIADESLREQYTDAKYTFVACDMSKLLRGTLPDALSIHLELGVDANVAQTIYMADSFSIEYSYKVDIPFTLDNSFEIYYDDTITGLNPTFSMLAGYDFKVGDLTIIVTIANSTPLEFAPQVTLKDADGNVTDAQVVIAEGTKIAGSSDGVTPAESVIRLGIDLGEDGCVANVGVVDAVQIELSATCAAGETAVPLNDKQYVGVKLQLEITGGITLDIDKITSK